MDARRLRRAGTALVIACSIAAALVGVLVASGWADADADAESPAPPPQIDEILVHKEARRMQLLAERRIVRAYSIALGARPEGHKQEQGDERTPEGRYTIDARNPESAFFLSLHVSYPNAEDRARAREQGVSPGGDIMIHGLPKAWAWVGPLHRLFDWTDGCIAVTNDEMQEIWDLVPIGTPIEIGR